MSNDDRVRTAFRELEFRVAGHIDAEEGLARLEGRRRVPGLAIAVAAAVFALVAVGIVGLVASLGGDDPESGVATIVTAPPTVVTTAPPPPTTAAPVDTAPSVPVPAGEPPLLVAADEGRTIARVTADDSAQVIVQDERNVDLVVSDLAGGVVYQRSSDGLIFQQPEAGRGGLLFLDGDLQDVAMVDGRRTVIVSNRVEVPDTEVFTGEVVLYDLDYGVSRMLAEIPATRVSYGGGLFLLTIGEEEATSFIFLDRDGRQVDFSENPYPEGQFDFFVTEGAIAPDGESMAFASTVFDGTASPRTTLEIVPFREDRRAVSVEIPEAIGTWYRITYDGSTASVSAAGSANSFVVTIASRGVRPVGVSGTASLEIPPQVYPEGDAARPPTVLSPRPALEPGDLLVADALGVTVLRGVEATRLTDEPALVAFHDAEGGVVYQSTNLLIRHLPVGEDAPRTLLDGSGADPSRLAGVAVINDVRTAYYVQFTHPIQIESTTPVAGLIPLDDGDITLIDLGDGGEGGALIRFGGDVLAVTHGYEGSSWIDVLTTTGEPSPLASPASRNEDRETQVDWAVPSPDGTRLLYLETAGFASDLEPVPAELILYDLGAGVEILRTPVPEGSTFFTHLDYDGTTVVLTRQTRTNPTAYRTTSETLVTTLDGEWAVLPVDGAVSLY